MKRIAAGAAAVALGLVVGVDAGMAQEAYDVSGREVAIYNLAGKVEVVPGTGSEVVVDVRRGGADAERLEVEVGVIDGRQALRVLYPDDRVVYERMSRRSRTDVRVRSDGTFYGNGARRGDRVRIQGGGDGLEAYADLIVRVPANRSVSVYLAAGEVHGRDVEGDLLFDMGSASATVTGVVGMVEVDTGSGTVEVTDVQGDVMVDTGSGNVHLSQVDGAEVNVDTGSGTITGSAIRAPTANFDTGSGRIEIDGLSAADVVCDTGSGSVDLRMETDVDRLEVDTGSGSVALWLPDGAGAEIEVDTGSGAIDVDVPVRVRESTRTYLEGSLGDGDGSITVDTGSGSIAIRSN